MDKYILVLLIFMVAGMVIGISQTPPHLILFYASLAGALILIAYTTIKNRREQQALRRARKKSKKR